MNVFSVYLAAKGRGVLLEIVQAEGLFAFNFMRISNRKYPLDIIGGRKIKFSVTVVWRFDWYDGVVGGGCRKKIPIRKSGRGDSPIRKNGKSGFSVKGKCNP